MVALSNTFEGGGADETAMTQGSGGNTGGASGDYFDLVSGGSGAAPTGDRKVFSTAQSRHGSYSALLYSAASGNEYFAWTTQFGSPLTSGTVYVRAYMYFSAFAGSGASKHIRLFDSGGVEAAYFRVDASPNPGIADSAGTFNEPSGPVTLSTGQWYRVELSIPIGNSVTITGRLFYGGNIDGTTADVEWSQAASDTLTATGDIAEVRFANTVAGPIVYWDDVAVSDTGWIGPPASSTNVNSSDSFSVTDSAASPGGGTGG